MHAAFLRRGCVIVRQGVGVELLARMRAAVHRAYERKPGLHVYSRDFQADAGATPFALLANPKFKKFLALVYSRQLYLRMNATARRIQGAEENREWQEPLSLHLDAQFHRPQFTVNFWTPTEDCGIDRPTLQLVPVDYMSTRHYTGYTGRLLRQSEEAKLGYFSREAFLLDHVEKSFGEDCFLRPTMRAGDVIIASNWILHGTYRTPAMREGRTSLEIRFIGTDLDVRPYLRPVGRRVLGALTARGGETFTKPMSARDHAPWPTNPAQ